MRLAQWSALFSFSLLCLIAVAAFLGLLPSRVPPAYAQGGGNFVAFDRLGGVPGGGDTYRALTDFGDVYEFTAFPPQTGNPHLENVTLIGNIVSSPVQTSSESVGSVKRKY